MAKLRKKRRAKYPLTTMIPRLEQWLDSDLGQHLLASEKQIVDQRVGGLFGYHLLQMSVSRKVELFEQSVIRHKFALTPLNSQVNPNRQGGGVVAAPESLPLESDAIDVVLLHHVLEYSQKPHRMLREAARIVVPHGYLIIVGFNPWSLLGAWSMAAGLLPQTVWQNRHISIARLYDWLALLDFKIQSIDYGFYRPPIKQLAVLQNLSFIDVVGDRLGWPTGGIYVMVAKKEVATLTPIRPRWFKKPKLLAGLEPSIYGNKMPKKHTLH